MSPSSRRAWIEIITLAMACPRATVALLAEGVDRNYEALQIGSRADVALLAEGVDRNVLVARRVKIAFRSPSSRRAWIEMV